MSDDFASVDAYIAGLEDASGIVEAIQAHLAPCPDCDASGYATTYDGRTLGVCSTCNGFGGRHLAALSSVPDVPAARDEPEPPRFGSGVAE